MAEDSNSNGQMDRRALIKKAGAGAAIAWAAPTVLATTAGAQTTTCYFGKFDSGNGSGTASVAGDATECGFGSATGGAGTAFVSYSNPKPGEPNEFLTANVTVPEGCDILGVALKAGNSHQCLTFSGGDAVSATVSGNQAISHTDVFYCCTSTGSMG